MRLLPRLLLRRPLITVVVVFVLVGLAASIGGRVPGVLARHGGDPFIDAQSKVARTNDVIERASGASPNFALIALVDLDAAGADRVNGVVDALRQHPREVTGIQAPLDRQGRIDPTSPLLSKDGTRALVTARTPIGVEQVAAGVRVHRAIPPMEGVQWGGGSLVTQTINEQIERDLGRAESIALPVLLLVAIFVFRSLLGGVLPLLVGGGTMMLTFATLYGVDAWVTPVSNFALNLVIALALGLGVDYALLIVTRWREVRYDAGSAADASRRTLRLVGPTIISSSLSVAAAMGALLAFPMLFLRSMAIGGVVCALLAGIMALVFVPAALALVGDRLDAGVPRRLRIEPGTVGGSRVWGSLARLVMRRPVLVAVATSVALLVIASPALHIKIGGVDATAVKPGTEIRNVDDALRTQFSGITVAGMRVAVRTSAQGEVAPQTMAAIADVAAASKIALPLQQPQPAGDGLAIVEVPVTGDPQRPAASRLLADLRDLDRGDIVGVTGETARIRDALHSLREHAPWAVLIAGLTTLIFVFLFTGSVLLPFKTVIMNALGACAAFGVLVFVFQEGRFEGLLGYSSPGTIESSQPILLAAVAFGLATDYGLILLGRIREERLKYGVSERDAIATGLVRTGRMVSSAALLLSIALGAFATSGVVFIKELGIGIVVAVVLDATVVRGLLVPSLMVLFGKWNWWAPAPLRRFHERFGLRD